jgi:vacuolar-type H+-ATPase subunit E/Vma4
MATTNQDSAGILREEILAEARRESQEILNRARQDAEDVLATAAAGADKVREEQLDRARAEAARRRELILAAVPVEAGRLRIARVESLLESVHEEARQRLIAHDGFEYRKAVINLAAIATSRMAGVAFVVKVPEADRTLLGDGLAEEVRQRIGRPALNVTVSYEPDIAGGGVIVEDAEARQMWDNRLLRRLERMWPELRRQIAVQASFVPRTESGGNRQ